MNIDKYIDIKDYKKKNSSNSLFYNKINIFSVQLGINVLEYVQP